MSPKAARRWATLFGLGQIRPAPGTCAALAALPAAALLTKLGGHGALLLAVAALFGLGVAASARHAPALTDADREDIVIDDLVGQWVALLVAPVNPAAYALAFIAYRVCVLTKPGPVAWAAREVGGGLGIMADDVVAGSMAGLALFTLGLVFPLFRGH